MLYQNLNIDPQQIPAVEEMTFLRHPKRYLKMRMVLKILLFVILAVAPLIMWYNQESYPAMIFGAVWLVIVLLLSITEIMSFPMRGYVIRERDITYKKGWVFRSMTTVPFNRIQHSEVSQGPLSRMMNLSSLNIFTAGGSSSDLSIDGLEPEEAERLRDWITQKIATHV